MHDSNLPSLLTAIWERLSTLTDYVAEGRAETNQRLSSIERQLLNGRHRMNDMERQQKASNRGS